MQRVVIQTKLRLYTDADALAAAVGAAEAVKCYVIDSLVYSQCRKLL